MDGQEHGDSGAPAGARRSQRDRWGAGGLVFVGCMFVGWGVGYLVGAQQAGWLIGMGAGFIGMALTRLR